MEQQQKKGKRKAFRFNDHKDTLMLRQVAGDNPFGGDKRAWRTVTAQLKKTPEFEGLEEPRTIRERTNRLVDMFVTTNNKQMNRSGEVEDLSEKEVLLETIAGMREAAECEVKPGKKEKEDEEEKKRREVEIREAALEKRRKKDRGASVTATATATNDEEKPEKTAVAVPRAPGSGQSRDDRLFRIIEERENRRHEEKEAERKLRQQELDLEKEKVESEKQERAAMLLVLQQLVAAINKK